MNKLCFILPSMDAGGVENYVLRYLRQYPIDGVTLLIRSKNRGDLQYDYEKTNVRINTQTIGHLNIWEWFKVYRFFLECKFTTVCDFGGNFAGPIMFLAKLAGVKHRITFYRRSSNAFSESAIKLMYNTWVNRLVYRYSTRILSNSQHAFDFFFPYAPKDEQRFRVIPNGVDLSVYQKECEQADTRSELNVPADRFIVGHVGRLDWSKNHETIFKVARKFKDTNSMAIFVFAGKGTDTKAFKDKLKAYGIEDVCIGLGLLDNLPVFYKTMDLFYFPSVTEGQPNALIEAMVAGTPTLTSNIPSIKEMMPPEMQKLLINPLDDQKAFTQIQQCMDDHSYLNKFKVDVAYYDTFDSSRNFGMFREELFRE